MERDEASYVYERRVHFRQRTRRQAQELPPYSVMAFPGAERPVFFEIIIYDEEILSQVRSRCPDIHVTHCPSWLRNEYMPLVPRNAPQRLIRDYHRFKRYYFDHNPDPDRLLERLQSAMRARGVVTIPESPPDPEQFRDFSPFVDSQGSAWW